MKIPFCLPLIPAISAGQKLATQPGRMTTVPLVCSVAESDRSQPSLPVAPTLPTVLLSYADTNVGIPIITTTILKAPKLKALTPQNCSF